MSDPAPLYRPIRVMAQVSKILEDAPVPLTAGALAVLCAPIKHKVIRQAIATLIREGHVAEGDRRTLRLLEPFPPEAQPVRPATAEYLGEVVFVEVSHLIGNHAGARMAGDPDELARIRAEITQAAQHLTAALELLEPHLNQETPRATA